MSDYYGMSDWGPGWDYPFDGPWSQEYYGMRPLPPPPLFPPAAYPPPPGQAGWPGASIGSPAQVPAQPAPDPAPPPEPSNNQTDKKTEIPVPDELDGQLSGFMCMLL